MNQTWEKSQAHKKEKQSIAAVISETNRVQSATDEGNEEPAF